MATGTCMPSGPDSFPTRSLGISSGAPGRLRAKTVRLLVHRSSPSTSPPGSKTDGGDRHNRQVHATAPLDVDRLAITLWLPHLRQRKRLTNCSNAATLGRYHKNCRQASVKPIPHRRWTKADQWREGPSNEMPCRDSIGTAPCSCMALLLRRSSSGTQFKNYMSRAPLLSCLP